jgi:hypothetical protein
MRTVRTTRSAPPRLPRRPILHRRRRVPRRTRGPRNTPRERERGSRAATSRERTPAQETRRHRATIRQAQGRSSVGRAPVSKTGCRRFESCRPCLYPSRICTRRLQRRQRKSAGMATTWQQPRAIASIEGVNVDVRGVLLVTIRGPSADDELDRLPRRRLRSPATSAAGPTLPSWHGWRITRQSSTVSLTQGPSGVRQRVELWDSAGLNGAGAPAVAAVAALPDLAVGETGEEPAVGGDERVRHRR